MSEGNPEISREVLMAAIEIVPVSCDVSSFKNALGEGHSINWSFNPDSFDLKVWAPCYKRNREHRIVDPDGFYHGTTGLITSEGHFYPRSDEAKLGQEYFQAIERKLRKFL